MSSLVNCPTTLTWPVIYYYVADVKAKPLGCMTDALSSASASFEVLQRQLSECVNSVDLLQKTVKPSKSLASSTSSASVTTLMVESPTNFFHGLCYIYIYFSIDRSQFYVDLAAFSNDLGDSSEYGGLITPLPDAIPSTGGCASAAAKRGAGMHACKQFMSHHD